MADISSDPATAVSALVRGYKARSARRLFLILAAVAALCLLVIADVMTGPASLSFTDVVSVLLNPSDATVQHTATALVMTCVFAARSTKGRRAIC